MSDNDDERQPDLIQASTIGCLALLSGSVGLLLYLLAILIFHFLGVEFPNPYHLIR